MVFNVIVCPAFEKFCNFCPLIPVTLMGIKHYFLLFIAPGFFIYLWVEMIMPSLLL